ncbi:hypothetical protein KA005_45440 [bacterium]|nr:hypothetical protein [bacterium]
MKNLWPESFKEYDAEPPKVIFEQQAKLLPKLTGDLVYAEVSELSTRESLYDGLRDDFRYGFYLTGKFLENYSFKVLSFSHDIAFYPAKLNIDSEIKKELGIKSRFVEVESPVELESLLQKFFSSKRLSKVIGSIMKISKT